MWICCDHIRVREGSWANSLLLLICLLCWCREPTDAVDTNIGTSRRPPIQSILSSKITLPTENPIPIECKNLTSANSRLSVIDSAGSNLPIVPPSLLNGILTCQPYQGIYVNHIYFQLANAFFLLSHLASSGLHGVLYLRCTLLVGCAFLALWAWTVVCWLDAALWNSLFIVINFVHVCTLLYKLRPVKFSKEIEEVYMAVFLPLRVSRPQFKKVLNCMKIIRQLKYQELYAQEKVTKVDSLSLVLSGKLVVSQNGKALHIVFPHQFLDSPEWFGVSTDEFFQVSITAMEESRILLWHRDKLKLSIMTDQFLQAVFDHILGRDVVKKLMQVSETMAASSHQHQNGQVIGMGGTTNQDSELEAKMFVVKKAGENQGITALISRQLQEERVPLLYSSSNVLVNALHRHPDLQPPTTSRAPYLLLPYPSVRNSLRSLR